MKPLVLTPKKWDLLKDRLRADYSPSVTMVRWKMRDVLGFTHREHTEWLGYYDDATQEERKEKFHGYHTMIHLDFYDESKRTMFLLKYSDYVTKSD